MTRGNGREPVPSGVSTGGAVWMVIVLLSATACRGDAAGREPVAAVSSDGVIADSGAVPMRVGDYRLTPTGTTKWVSAQRALGELPADTAFVPLARRTGSAADVDRVVAYLESRPETRRAIEQSGLSVRDYVLTSLALAHAEAALRTSGDGRDALDDNAVFLRAHRDELVQARHLTRLRVVADDEDDGEFEHDEDHGRGHRHRHGRGHDGDDHDDHE